MSTSKRIEELEKQVADLQLVLGAMLKAGAILPMTQITKIYDAHQAVEGKANEQLREALN